MSRMLRLTEAAAVALLLLAVTTASSQEKKQPAVQKPDPNSIYQLGPDSKKQPDVPEGKRSDKLTLKSKVYPDTERDYWYYLPPDMDKSKPAKVMVFQDGWNYCNPKGLAQLGNVFDNLIHKKEIPPMVGVFVNPGVPLDSDGTRITDRNKINAQRSLEYDTLSPRYAEFLEKDLLPRIEKDTGIKFSTDPNDRAISGLSSGGICAFTVAWERPDLFRKVLSHIGSFTNIKGGHVYPAQIRKSCNPRSRSVSSCRMAPTILITEQATGRWRTRRWLRPSSSASTIIASSMARALTRSLMAERSCPNR
ncbi:MAG: alpha/beta hydrolase-fold protein [Gemmatales bacterium]